MKGSKKHKKEFRRSQKLDRCKSALLTKIVKIVGQNKLRIPIKDMHHMFSMSMNRLSGLYNRALQAAKKEAKTI